MKNIKVTIENCYGISKLEHEFDFTETNSAYVIYAPNGVMKSSFANVFDDYSKDKDSSDLVFKDRISLRKIIDASGNEIDRESIFVIRPYEKKYKSNRVSTLLVKEELKKRYSEIHEKIDSAKDLLMKELKKNTKLNKVEDEITSAFSAGKSKILEILYQLEDSVSADS
ncbi:hypothetical protein GC101_22200 [Paenibacillus sp. LMG 31459]|uniref:Rad50/SbcC-type AAA domain-containing protein n=1 Tax=Paenibacillus phytohabitans TaxID=2654978 RepID=A0ABX1YKV3_9BACL|nr:hypothetical protein [Paenibacillus phytohabitans]NOU81577.1 hypothetical protein [Paenibacillus phytohabitans]